MEKIIPNTGVSLGLGLLSLGRVWGYSHGLPPSEADALELLHHATSSGITFFDTAPAYGTSERIFGRFLKDLRDEGHNLTISTKMGEHWDGDAKKAFTDHSYDSLCRSLDRSLALLGRIDLLQIHKATPEVLASKDVSRAIEYARARGIKVIGASVADLDAARLVCGSERYTYIQFPYNCLSTTLAPIFEMAWRANIIVLINRPFAMGQLIADRTGDPPSVMREALSFILHERFRGIVLTGTRSKQHLNEAIAAFRSAAHPEISI